jgi:hypothetical protein
MEVMLEPPMNGFIKITLLTRLAHHIKHMVMTMALDAQDKLNAEIVSQTKDVGLKKELKSIALINMQMLKDNKL